MITRESDYAIRILSCMAWHHDRFLSSTELAERTGVPYRFLRKIARRLLVAKLLVSVRGRKGGMRLARPPAQISLLDVIDATDPRGAVLNACVGGRVCDGHARCKTQGVLMRLQKRLRGGLQSVRFDRLADSWRSGRSTVES
jgi:Rrf2 family protein